MKFKKVIPEVIIFLVLLYAIYSYLCIGKSWQLLFSIVMFSILLIVLITRLIKNR
ncbi:hypothetical protein A5889_001948 [Enterococcus sp. 9D6_DIV0238]|uniref:Uncharacterized protein n=1 Tax=Candidatus Enterococcus dunnyi TaxID=1834192 RepID=A0AAQ3W6P3_9ENTE